MSQPRSGPLPISTSSPVMMSADSQPYLPALEDVDAVGRGIDRTRHPTTGPPYEDLAVANGDDGPEAGGPPRRLVLR